MWSWWRGSGGELRRVGKAKRAHHLAHAPKRQMVGTAQVRLCPPYEVSSPPPPVLPDLLADQAIHARFLGFRRRGHDRAFRLAAGDFQQQLGADRFLEFFAVLDRD